MSWVRRVPVLVLASVMVVLPTEAQESSRAEVWITLGAKEAAHLQEALSRSGRDDVLQVEAEGEIVVARIREDRIPLLSRIVHRDLHRCGGFVAHPSRDEAFQAVARELSLLPVESLVDYTIDNGPVVQTLMGGIQEANIRSTITSLSAFFTRYHTTQTGQDSANWIRSQWAGYAQGRSDVTVQLFSHPSSVTPQPSVILTIQGTTLPAEVVVLGAHQDSINGGATGRSPGADDDASGVASLSEVIRVAMANGYRPQRTVKFMAYAAEEVGLRGSGDIAAQHRAANVNVVGVLQLDMTNYKGTAASDIVIITDRTNATQNAFVGQLVDTYLGLPRTTTQCGYGCSDHSSWNSQGYVASFPFEAVFGQHNPTIHTANDTLAQSGNNANHAVKFSKLAAAYLAELAKGGFGGGSNLPPTVNAGPDRSVAAGATATLSGSGSDPDNGPSPLAFSWSQVSGSPVSISNANQAVASVTPAAAGTYVFRLTASDGAASVSDQMTVTATAAGTTVFFDNFETNTGWTVNPTGADTATAGRWERGDPEATTSSGAKQLGTTVSGVNDLVTGRLAGSSAGVHDLDGGVTRIQSPLITLPSSGSLSLSFQYYLAHGSNSSSADFFRAFVVSGTTSTQVFQSLGAASNRNAAWTPVTVNLGAFAGQTIRIRFEAADASTASLVEAAVDDVRVTRQ